MKKVTFILAAFLIFGVTSIVEAGDKKTDSHGLNIGIPTHAMIALAGTGIMDLYFEAKAASVAGDQVVFSQSDKTELWLNYSSIVNKGNSNTITASVSELPAGLVIEVAVSKSAAQGKKGSTGAGFSKPLTTEGVLVVDGIKSCYTGAGEGRGHSLVYNVKADDAKYEDIVSAKHGLTVTYTITEN